MKKNLLFGEYCFRLPLISQLRQGKFLSLLTVLLVIASFGNAQDTTMRTRLNASSFTSNTTWEYYSEASGGWVAAPAGVVPSANKDIIIRDGHVITSNSSGIVVKSLTVGEGGGAIAVAVVTGDAVSSVNIIDPGQLVFIPTPVFTNGGQVAGSTVATASVTSVKVTGISVNNPGSGYTNATVAFAAAPAGGTTATGDAIITAGKITGITITNPGTGYTSIPAITITGDGTGAAVSAKVGIEAINVTNGGTGYVQTPTVYLGSQFQVGNSTNNRSVQVNGDVVFKKGAVILSGGGSASSAETLVIGGNLSAETPITFMNSNPTSTGVSNSSTTVSFIKNGTATITGSFQFRSITFGVSTVVMPSTELNIAGNINKPSNVGPFTGGIDASNTTLKLNTFSAPASYSIPDSAFLNGVVKNLTMNNTGGVTLNQSISLTGSWLQQAGIFTIRPGKTVTIPTPAAITGAYGATNYIATDTSLVSGTTGILQINNITSSKTFPVGDRSNYLPVTVSPSTSSNFAVNVFTPATDNGTVNGPVTSNNNIVNAIYNVNRIVGSGTTQLTLGFPSSLKGSGLTGIQNNQLGISRFNGTTWDPVTGSGDNTQNFATSTFIAFSPFRVEFNATPTSLPVKLGDIVATKSNGQVVLKWNVYDEINVSSYVIERSVDGGRTYAAVGSVKANGNSSYNLVDGKPATAKNFYRLKALDVDGRATYSRILLVDFSKITASLSVSPNPVVNGMFTVRFANMREGKVMVRLYSNIGQLVMNQPISYNGSTDNQLINLPAGTAKGNYRLVITDGINTQKASVIVQ